MSLDKKIENIFNNEPSLENENWLELGDDFYAGIESQIAEQPKQKRRFLLWWLGAGLSVLIAMAVIYILSSSSTQSLGQNVAVSSSEEISNIAQVQKDLSIDDATVRLGNIGNTNPTLDNKEKAKSSLIIDSSHEMDVVVKNATVFNYPTNDKSQNPINASLNPSSSIDPNRQSSQRIIEPKNFDQNINDNPITINDNPITINDNYDVREALIDLELLNNSNTSLNYERALANVFIPSIKPIKGSTWQYGMNIGYAYGRIMHNNEYKLAVEPAAYRNSNYSSVEWDFSLTKIINTKLSVYGTLGYSSATFTSGHNANVNYDLDQEVDMSNTLDIDMATPLGFINSEIVIRRDELDLSGGNMLMDLHNEHQLNDLYADLGIKYNIINYKNIGLSLLGGLGHRYTLNINNTLGRIDLSESGYSYQSRVSNDLPQYLNRNRWYSQWGTSLDWKIGRQSLLNMKAGYRYQWNNIYQQDGFSVRMSDVKLSLGYARQF